MPATIAISTAARGLRSIVVARSVLDDAFDLAKALVSALFYGMTQSRAGRGRIEVIGLLLRKLIGGGHVGPATAIGEDYSGRAAHRHGRSNRDICGAKQPTQACSSLVRLLAPPGQASRFNPSMICPASFLLCLSRYASARRSGRSSRSSSTLSVACAGLNCSDRTRSAR